MPDLNELQTEETGQGQGQGQKLEFKRAAIKVCYGTHIANIDVRPGWALADTGLGYYHHPYLPDRVRPTHLPTGYALSHHYMTLENCQAYLREIAGICDWHAIDKKGPDPELGKELIVIREKYVAVPWDEEGKEE